MAARLALPCPGHVMISPMLRAFLPPLAALACFAASTMPPEADQRLVHNIYKEIVEIQSGYTTGATPLAADAIAP